MDNDSDPGLDHDKIRVDALADAINAASIFENDSGHTKGSFCALVTQDDTDTFLNLYFTSSGQGESAPPAPELKRLVAVAGGSVTAQLNMPAVEDVEPVSQPADPVFVTIRQEAATFTDAYAFADIAIQADLDPNREFLTYYDYETTSGEKLSI